MTQAEHRGRVDVATRRENEGAVAPNVPLPRAAPAGRVIVARLAVRRDRLAALDGLRFLAALAVVLFHFVGQTPWSMITIWGRPYRSTFPEAHGYFAYGRLGVDLFFLISGFV